MIPALLAFALAAVQEPAAEPIEHFDAAEMCDSSGVREWDVSYTPEGRLRMDVWCLNEPPVDYSQAFLDLPEPDRSIAISIERKNGPDAERRCTVEYQRETNWRYLADDRDDCPNLPGARPRRGR